jgi:hypothetical protein
MLGGIRSVNGVCSNQMTMHSVAGDASDSETLVTYPHLINKNNVMSCTSDSILAAICAMSYPATSPVHTFIVSPHRKFSVCLKSKQQAAVAAVHFGMLLCTDRIESMWPMW